MSFFQRTKYFWNRFFPIKIDFNERCYVSFSCLEFKTVKFKVIISMGFLVSIISTLQWFSSFMYLTRNSKMFWFCKTLSLKIRVIKRIQLSVELDQFEKHNVLLVLDLEIIEIFT